MASLSAKSSAKAASASQQEEKKAARRAVAARVPAFAQAKLAVSRPDDAHEREADRVAAQVARAARTPESAQRAGVAPGITPGKESLAPKAVPAAAEISRKAADPAGQEVSDSVEARIDARRGGGAPLPESVLNEMQGRLGQDFSAVRIHADQEAAELCAEMRARAFTVGSDIFFAPGEYAPGAEAGRELLAHELTHVVQQGGGVSRWAIPEDNGQPHAPRSAEQAAYERACTVDIPQPKTQHRDKYMEWAGAGRLMRPRGKSIDRDTNQVSIWNKDIEALGVTQDTVKAKLTAQGVPVPTAARAKMLVTFNGREKREGTLAQLTRLAKIPDWDRQGDERHFQVDHMIEYQVAVKDVEVDSINNYELFDPFLNKSSGSTLMHSIRGNVAGYLKTLPGTGGHARAAGVKPSSDEVDQWLDGHDLRFEDVAAGKAQPAWETGSWSVYDVMGLKPFDKAAPVRLPSKGDADEFVLCSTAGGFELARVKHDPANPAFPVPARLAGAIAGLKLQQITLNGAEGTAAAGDGVGALEATLNLPPEWMATRGPATQTLALKSCGEYMGYIESLPPLDLDFKHLSPVHFGQVTTENGRLSAEGVLTPSIPLLGAPLTVSLSGANLTFSMRYGASQLRSPMPGMTIDEAALELFYSTANGFGVSGEAGFSLPKVGSGRMRAGVSQEGGFSVEGGFDFDAHLFDRASIEVFYRDGQFGGGGEIGIDTPNKIKGIQSANLAVQFQEGAFSATGEVQPSIPGVQQAGLTVAHSEEEGLIIGGSLQLAPNPAIRSGSVEVTVKQVEELWKVSAAGAAQPAIPGINTELRVAYDDGAFTAEASGEYGRGMLKGTAHLGVTNRSLDEAGQPTGAPTPEAPLIVYGGGSATITFAPWLQGAAGMEFQPDGKVVVSGEIGLPSALTIFPRKEIDKSLFSLATQIPIVPGIVAEVGGNLKAIAGIGPGQLDQLRIGVDHYEPEDESKTHITGDAHLNVPADAGLRLAARAGVGLGITGASATGGLELGGMAGIAGAAEAGVHIDWTPGAGLAIDAEGYLHAEPKFKFDVSGYVAVTVAGFEVYGDTYEFAALELGSDLRLGVKFPVHYQEGQPFDVSLDDVEFEVPEVNTDGLLSDLGERVFGAEG